MLIERSVICFECKTSLQDSGGATDTEREPCPHCGSLDRAVHIVTAGYIRSFEDLHLDFQDTPKSRPEGEAASAAERPRLVIVQRQFCADRDRYIEHVEAEATGEVLWHVESPLGQYVQEAAGIEPTRDPGDRA